MAPDRCWTALRVSFERNGTSLMALAETRRALDDSADAEAAAQVLAAGTLRASLPSFDVRKLLAGEGRNGRLEKPMNTRLWSAIAAPMLLAISGSVWAEDTKETAKAADEAQLKKQCDDMKNMDMSKMSSAEHEAMMKKCREMTDRARKAERRNDY